MAKENMRELRELPADTLAGKIREMETNLFNLRFQASMGKLENTAVLRNSRREIARAKTVLKQASATAVTAAAPKAAARATKGPVKAKAKTK